MPPSQLETLPEELLQYICELLESRQQSLRAFSITSKRCYSAALPTICRYICLVIWLNDRCEPTRTRLDLLPRIESWLSFLDRRSAKRHVRSLMVTQKENDSVITGASYPEYLDSAERDDALLVSPERRCDWNQWSEPAAKYPPKEQCDTVWERLSQLIGRLPALTSFTWDCSWPLPDQIIAALQHRPLADLHLNSFWFADEMREENTSPTELALLSDSRLRSITSRSIEVLGYCKGDYTHEAILDLVSGINPYVRHVSFLSERNQHSPGSFFLDQIMKVRDLRAPWPGLRRPRGLRAPCAKLQSLEVGPLSIGLFHSVFQNCDLTELQVLKLLVHYNYKGLDYITSSVRFPRLRSLVFGSTASTTFLESEHGEKSYAVPFINSLPSLKAIRFVAQVDQDILDSTLQRHRPSLQRLWFAPPSRREELSFDAQQVTQLRQSLPLLEDLATSIPRSLGDESEVALYRCFGSFSRLSRLSLYLDCDDANLLVDAADEDDDNYDTEPVYYADFDDFDREHVSGSGPFDTSDTRQVRNGHVRHALMNAALDKNLARAIFDAIATSKPGLASDIPLQRLELRPIRGEYYSMTVEIFMHLSQWWLVESFAGRAEGVRPITTPIRCPGDRDLEAETPALPVLEIEIDRIFQKIWPRASASDSWYYGWSSLPLKT